MDSIARGGAAEEMSVSRSVRSLSAVTPSYISGPSSTSRATRRR